MRVLMTNWVYPPEFSGAALQCHRLSQELVKMGVHVDVLAGTDYKSSVGTDYVDGIKVVRILRDKSTLYKKMYYAKQLAMYIVQNRKKYDIIHAHGFMAPVNIIAKLARIPIVQKITNLYVDDPATVRRRRLGMLQFTIFKFARIIVPTSRRLEESCKKHLKNINQYQKLPNGVDIHFFRPVPQDEKNKLIEQLELPKDHFILLTVGTVSHRKGVASLITAYAKLVETVDKKVHLVLVGPDFYTKGYKFTDHKTEQFVKKVRQDIQELGLEKHVTILGMRDNVHQYMKAADLYVHPSRQEGQPNAILEAMACGLPVIANLINGITDEMLQNGRFGYVTQCANKDEFAAAMRVLVNNEKLQQRLGNSARFEVMNNYSIWRIAEKYRELYERILQNKLTRSYKTSHAKIDREALLKLINIKHKS